MSIMIGVCFLLHGKISQMIPIYSVNLLTVKVFLTLFPLAVVRAPQHTARRCTPTSSSYRLHEVSDCKSLATKQLRIISTSFQISGRNHASQWFSDLNTSQIITDPKFLLHDAIYESTPQLGRIRRTWPKSFGGKRKVIENMSPRKIEPVTFHYLHDFGWNWFINCISLLQRTWRLEDLRWLARFESHAAWDSQVPTNWSLHGAQPIEVLPPFGPCPASYLFGWILVIPSIPSKKLVNNSGSEFYFQ